MISQVQFALLSACLTTCLGDYHVDHSAASNYIYPDYQGYGVSAYDSYNTSQTSRKRRVFTDDYTLNLAFTIDVTIPVPDFDSELLITVPFSYDIPTTTKRSFSGRSFSSALESPRASLYKNIERYMGQMTGADGHACLLRAMCEASSHPLHNEGFLGDAVNFLLTANYAAEESDDKFKEYLKSQSDGQLKGDCTEFHKNCPISFFKLLDNSIL